MKGFAKQFSRLFLISIFLVSSIGCATQRGWRYTPSSMQSRKPLINKTLAVAPFVDAREDKNKDSLLMYMVPIVPYGKCDYSAPEGGGQKLSSMPIWQFRPSEDLAKAAAEELNASGLFKEVFFTQRPSEGDLVFRGKINSTRYKGKMMSYGLSVYGPMLWLIGLPAGNVENELNVDFSLEDNSTKEKLWSKNFEEEYKKTAFIYNLPSDFAYDILYKKALLDAIKDIENSLIN